MKIQVVSDLHLELHNPLPALAEGADVIVCAGDLAPIGTGAVRYAAEEWAEARHMAKGLPHRRQCTEEVMRVHHLAKARLVLRCHDVNRDLRKLHN